MVVFYSRIGVGRGCKMKKYKVTEHWQGYSRGTTTYLVEADDSEEAERIYWRATGKREIIRDDTTTTETNVELIED